MSNDLKSNLGFDINFEQDFISSSIFDELDLDSFIEKYRTQIIESPDVVKTMLYWEKDDLNRKVKFFSRFPALTLYADQNYDIKDNKGDFRLKATMDFSYVLNEYMNLGLNLNTDFKNRPNGEVTLSFAMSHGDLDYQEERSLDVYELMMKQYFLDVKYCFQKFKLKESIYVEFISSVSSNSKDYDKERLNLEISLQNAQYDYTNKVIRLYSQLGLLYKKYVQEGDMEWIYGK